MSCFLTHSVVIIPDMYISWSLCETSLRSLEWIWAKTCWPPARRPICKHDLWVHLYVGCHLYYYSAIRLILVFLPTWGRRLSWPKHYCNSMQPVPNAAYGSGFRENTETVCGAGWIMGPFVPQSNILGWFWVLIVASRVAALGLLLLAQSLGDACWQK